MPFDIRSTGNRRLLHVLYERERERRRRIRSLCIRAIQDELFLFLFLLCWSDSHFNQLNNNRSLSTWLC